jgi:hypothetical protein
VLNLLFLVSLALLLPRAYELGLEYGLPPMLRMLFWLPRITAVLTLLLLLALPLVWRRLSLPLLGRAVYTLVAAAAVGFIPLLGYWNLLSL